MLGQEYRPAFWGVTAVLHMGNCVHLNEIKSIKLNNLLPSNFVWSSSDLRKFNFLWTVFSTNLKYVFSVCIHKSAVHTKEKAFFIQSWILRLNSWPYLGCFDFFLQRIRRKQRAQSLFKYILFFLILSSSKE